MGHTGKARRYAHPVGTGQKGKPALALSALNHVALTVRDIATCGTDAGLSVPTSDRHSGMAGQAAAFPASHA
ncbi:hypothetical protein [Mycobacterium sp.]|uniref:hypothetical protein n=1 Tax=Mycobacterium sp. TaxID=1785 RepID=UPI0031D2591A